MLEDRQQSIRRAIKSDNEDVNELSNHMPSLQQAPINEGNRIT